MCARVMHDVIRRRYARSRPRRREKKMIKNIDVFRNDTIRAKSVGRVPRALRIVIRNDGNRAKLDFVKTARANGFGRHTRSDFSTVSPDEQFFCSCRKRRAPYYSDPRRLTRTQYGVYVIPIDRNRESLKSLRFRANYFHRFEIPTNYVTNVKNV